MMWLIIRSATMCQIGGGGYVRGRHVLPVQEFLKRFGGDEPNRKSSDRPRALLSGAAAVAAVINTKSWVWEEAWMWSNRDRLLIGPQGSSGKTAGLRLTGDMWTKWEAHCRQLLNLISTSSVESGLESGCSPVVWVSYLPVSGGLAPNTKKTKQLQDLKWIFRFITVSAAQLSRAVLFTASFERLIWVLSSSQFTCDRENQSVVSVG